VLGDVAAGDVDARDGVRESEALVHRDRVRDAIAGVQDHARGATGRVQTEHGLRGHEKGGNIEGLEEDLGRLLSVHVGVQRRLGEKHLRRRWD
jgi:hypothetical protein